MAGGRVGPGGGSEVEGRSTSRGRRDERAGSPPRPSAPGLQVVRRADDRRIRWRDQRGRRTERLRQEQPRRRPALVARRAGPGASQPQVGGRDLRRFRQASGARHGRRDARPRQRRRAAPGRLQRPRARPPAVPIGRERLPAQQAARPAARPRRPARRGPPRRQRVPVHRPGNGRPGARAPTGGAPAAVRGGRRRPTPRATPAQGRGAARRVRGQPRPGRGHPRRAPAAGPSARGPGRAASDRD